MLKGLFGGHLGREGQVGKGWIKLKLWKDSKGFANTSEVPMSAVTNTAASSISVRLASCKTTCG